MLKALTAQLTPDTDGILVRFMVWIFGINWKSSLSGFLSFGIASFGVITSGLAPLAALNPTSALAKYSAITTAVLALLSGLGKAWVGLLMQDAGTVLAKLPRIAEPQIVASTETPLDPKAKVIP